MVTESFFGLRCVPVYPRFILIGLSLPFNYYILHRITVLKACPRIEYYDEKKDKKFVFITNYFHCQAQTIADIYKARWDIEIFFKWIKQNLKIKHIRDPVG